MAKTINPAFQAAPNLGASSFDPNEFMRRYNTQMYQQKRYQQDQNRKDFASGLKQLELDLDGLYDQQGINEVLGDNNRIKKAAMEAYTKGINVFSPTNAQSMEGNLAVKKALQETMKKVDTMRTNKADTALIFKLQQADADLPKEEQVYDWDATAKNLEKIKQNPGSILDTQGKLKEALVLNPTIGNVDKLMNDSKEYFTPIGVDPVTLQPDPKQVKQRQAEMIKFFHSGRLKPEHIRALEKERTRMAEMNPENEDLKVMPLDEFFAQNYTTKDFMKKSKPTRAPQDSNSGKIGFGGANVKLTPGVHNTNDLKYGERVYNDRYDFTTDKVVNVNSKDGEQYATIPDAKTGKTGWEPFEVSGNIEASLLFYDKKTNMLVFKSSATANLPWAENNAIFAVPVRNVKEADKFPIVLDNGKQGTLKDILPQESFGVMAKDVKNPIKWK